MGIQDRDYMKRRPDDDDDDGYSLDEKVDSFLGRFVSGHSGLLKGFVVALILLVVLGLLMAALHL